FFPGDRVGIAAYRIGLAHPDAFAALEHDLVEAHVAQIGDILDHALGDIGAELALGPVAADLHLFGADRPPQQLVGRAVDAVPDMDIAAQLGRADADMVGLVLGQHAFDHVDRADEAGDEFGIGIFIDIGGLADHGDLALVHHPDAGGQ